MEQLNFLKKALYIIMLFGYLFVGKISFGQIQMVPYPECGSNVLQWPCDQGPFFIAGPGMPSGSPVDIIPCPGDIVQDTIYPPWGCYAVGEVTVTGNGTLLSVVHNPQNASYTIIRVQIGCAPGNYGISACIGCFANDHAYWYPHKKVCQTANVNDITRASLSFIQPIASIPCHSTNSYTYCVNGLPCASSYQWTVPAGWTITGSTNQSCITVTPGDGTLGGTISVFAKDGCGNRSPTANITVTRPIDCSHFPSCSISPVGNVVCACPGSFNNFMASTGIPCFDDAQATYTWTITNDNSTFQTYTVVIPGNQPPTVTYGDGSADLNVSITTPCGTCTATYHMQAVSATPAADPVLLDGVLGGCQNGQWACWQAAVNNGEDYINCPTTFAWKLEDASGTKISNLTPDAGSGGQTVTLCGFPTNGNQICVQATNGCGTSNWVCSTISRPSCKISANPSDHTSHQQKMNEDNFDKSLSIKPNPSKGLFRIVLPEKDAVLEMNLVTSTGSVIKDILPDNASIDVNVTNLASGRYYLIIRTQTFTIVRSVEITK
jgi:hypothetical protein